MDEDYFGPHSRYVKELTPSQFDAMKAYKLSSTLKSVPKTNVKKCGTDALSGMVMFYAPWCGHCHALAPAWEEAAKISGFCNFYAFNCEKNKGHVLKIREEKPDLILSFPTIVYYRKGEPVEKYEGERDVQSLVKYCMNMCSEK
jgi:thiol-disulfide isomerase/thioredoxin